MWLRHASAINRLPPAIELPEVFPSNGVYQVRFVSLKDSGLSIDGVAFGDVFVTVLPTLYRNILNLLAGNVCSLSWERAVRR
ncbi:hypothetical protein OK016_08275 [Vibrio chagasii]|nr:hypothetical protein [Vibrio chagasii]